MLLKSELNCVIDMYRAPACGLEAFSSASTHSLSVRPLENVALTTDFSVPHVTPLSEDFCITICPSVRSLLASMPNM